MSLIDKLDYEIKTFIERWKEGESRVHDITLAKFGIIEPLTEEELEVIGLKIKHIEEIRLDEDNILFITVHEPTLKACFEATLQDWVEESDLRQFGRYESCGCF